MKKALALIMATTLVVSAFSGCTGKKQTANTLYDPTIKIGDTGGLELPLCEDGREVSWMVSSAVDGLNESYVAEKLRAITGVNVQLMTVSPQVYGQKVSTLVASKQLPDISGASDEAVAQDLCIQGAFAAVDDYLDSVPNFKRTFYDTPENKWVTNTYRLRDGKVYGFYGWDTARDINTGVAMYRKDIFDKHNIPMWNSPETFYETLKKLKELYPESQPFSMKQGAKTFQTMARFWGLSSQAFTFDHEKREWFYTDTSEEYREVLDFTKKLFDEGLLDPEFLTLTQAGWTSKMTQPDKAFVTVDWIGRMTMFKEQTATTVPGYDLRFSNPIGPDQKYNQTNQLCWARYVSNNDNAETAFKLLDFVLSPAGKELITMGIEGETYVIGEDGMADYIEFDHQPTINELEEKYGMFVEQVYLSFDRRSTYFNFTEAEKEAMAYVADPNHVRPLAPTLTYTEEEKDARRGKVSELNKAAEEFAAKYVLGTETGDEAWENWLKKAESLGVKELTEITNAAQKRFDAAE